MISPISQTRTLTVQLCYNAAGSFVIVSITLTPQAGARSTYVVGTSGRPWTPRYCISRLIGILLWSALFFGSADFTTLSRLQASNKEP